MKKKSIIMKVCRRLFICLVTWAVLFTQVNFDLLPIEAALPDVAPSITVSMSYVEGGTVPTDEDGKPVQGTVLVGRNGNNAAIIDLKMDAAFQNGKIHNPYFSINLPYFYLKDGALIETLNIDEVPADQKDADGNPQMGIRATVVDGGSYGVIQGQEFRGQSLLLDQSKPEDPDNKNIINGALVVITAGSSSTVRLKFDFYGDVPENTTGIASVGGGYLTYEGDTGEVKDYNVYQQNSDQYVFICSNLSWRTNIEQVSHNVMWDKYNYMVYKVSIENVSTDPQSVIDSDQLSIAVPVYEVDQYGVRRKDSRKWLYNAETGEITENTDIDHVNGKMFTGKPGDGGILIYDIDGISEEELSKWDLNTFKNVEEDNIPYYISAETGTFYIQDKEPIKSGEKKEYYFAIPFPRNFRQEDQQFTAQLYGTVYFSNGKYSWTQQDTTASSFEAPNPSFTHRKYVKDSDGAVQNKIQAAIGDNVNYYLDSFKNTGNLPAFNATVTDVLPENFDLRKVSIAMNIRDGKTPSLSDWFASENILSLEIKDGSETKFVPMGSFAEDVDLTTASKKVWSADISSLLQAYLKEHTTAEFTGRIQIHFKERIEVNEQLDGEIIINGDTTVLDNYINTLQTTYEEWLYVQETTTTEETYQKLNKTVTEDSATVEAQPGNPLIKVDTYLQEEGTTDYKEETSVPVYTENTGYRYELGNDSISNIIPAKFSTGELLKKNDEDGQFGFIADSLIFSEKLLQVSDINNVIFYYADGTNQTFTENDFVASSENNKKILVPSGKVLLSATVNFKKVNANLPLSDDVYMLLNGEPNQIGNLDVTGSFETQYNDPDVDKNATDKGTLNVSSINMTLFAKSFYLQEDGTKKESALNQSTSDQTKPTIHSLTVKNKQPNSGYEFEIENRSEAYSRDADILIDLSSSVGNKNTIDDPVVKGFLTQKIDITNINKTAVIRGIYIYDWNESLLMNNPSMVLNGEDLNDVISSDGDTISISQDKLEQYGIKRVHYVRLDLEDYKAQNNTNPEKMKIVLTGVSDWYDDLDAKITFTPDNIYMAQQIRDITGRLHVDRPEMSVQSNLNYYDNVKETTTSLADNDDQNRTQLAIPYDRDFNLHVTLNNKTISVLDNPYITVALPVNDETQGDESHTGFHATKIVLDDGLLTGYEDLAALSLYDVDQQDAVVLNYDKEQKAFVKDDKKFAINKDGSVVIEESDLNDLGITYLNKIILSGSNYGIQKEGHIDVYGFSDAALGKESITSVTTDNYLDGIQKEAYKVSAKDDSMFLTSKMYFDATITAGYKDSETEGGDRFDETATSREHVRKEYYTTNSSAAGSFLDDSELDVGYKAIGSYMVDFRQYLNAGTNYPTDPTRNNYYSQEMQGMNYVYTQSYNTAADVKMSVNLPSDEFETYYLKVDPRAKDYYQKIVVHYKDGTSTEIDQEDWKNNALETSSTGEKFFRINLMNADEENYYSNDESDYFKQAANYQIPENPVTGIDIYLRINEEESTNSADGSKIAKNPDYGTWYVANDQKTKYMFEITGRFYETGTAKATLSSDVTIGGDQLGNSATRTGVKAKERTNSEPTSTWSYNNQYIYHYYSGGAWHTGTALYDAQHLDSSVYVNVQHDNNEVLKGVQGNPNTEENLNVTYGEEYDYDVSFYRQGNGGDTDYKTGQDLTNWRYEDAYDWKNKISFADQIVLEDTLPLVHRDTTDQVSEYKGFLTKNIRVSDELYQYMDTIEITTQHVDENANKTAGQTITLSKEGIAESANNYHAINLKYMDLNETSGKDNEILLAHDEYVKSYRITLKNIPGSADYAREYSIHYSTMDAHGTASESDIKVGGNVYSIRDVDDKATYATNTISETTYADKGNPDQPAKIRNSNDSAAMMGYRIPFKAGFNIDSLNDRRIYDYQTDNLTPNSASFGVEIFNNGDGTATDGSQNAAHIKEATVTNTLNENYRLKTINIPKEFIDGDWFEVKQLTLYFSNQAVIISKNDLASYLTADGDTYHFDINGYIWNNVEKFPTYSVNNSDATYVKEQIKSFQIIFSAKNPIRNQESTILDASQYISSDKAKGYAFTYDGVYVDRTESDIEKNAWTPDSRPTYINQPNRFDDDYSSNDLYNDVDVKFVSSDMNAQNYGGNISGTDTRDYYELLNRVANMVVDLDRGTDINGTISFAYDQISNEESSSNDRLAVDRNHLIPDDYIEYTLTLGADTDSTIDLAKMYAHFEAPTGMRIIGWKIVSNDTGIEDDAITATAMEANGSAWDTLDKDKLYSINAGDSETNYKNLSISVGDKEEQSWVQAGKKIKIVVITQLTNEISDFEGKTITPVYEAAAEPVHTYSQYRVYRDGDRSDASNNAGITTPYTSNGDINFYHGFAAFFNDSNEHTHISRITSTVNFMDSNDLQIDYTFDDSIKHYDHQPMTMKVYGKNPTDITNDTQHPLDEATFEISFLSEQNGKLYKGFDLTEKPAFSYPSNMDSTDSEPIKIEYCYLESNTKDASDGEYIKNDVTEKWVSEENVVVNESDLSDGKYLLKDAVKIRWTYYDIPSLGTDKKEVLFASAAQPFILHGEGRYRDVRTDAQKSTQAYADRYNMELAANVTFLHTHNETVENTLVGSDTSSTAFVEDVSLKGMGETQKAIARERPVPTLHTQVFASEQEATAVYDPNAEQKIGYRPNETVWFKTTVKNKILTEKTADTEMQGALLDPVIYDKIPSYITNSLDENNVIIKWYDKDGNEKNNVLSFQIETQQINTPDYGGAMVINEKTDDGASTATGHAYQDIIFEGNNKNTSAEDTDYTVYKISFAEGTRLEVGERIELYYQATIAEENLPLMLTQKSDGSIYMDYYPKTGEYYQIANYSNYSTYATSYPFFDSSLIAAKGSQNYGFIRKLDNQDVMMDMSYLQHDVGLSGTPNDNIEPYEYLKDAISYIPGSSDDNSSYGGSNGYLKDYDVASAKNQQSTTYVPLLETGKIKDQPSADYVEYQINSKNRDYYEKLMRLRNRDFKQQYTTDASVVWAQSRMHLQMSWLATSSQFISQETDYLAKYENLPNGKYNEKLDSKYYPDGNYYNGNYNQTSLRARYDLYYDDTIPTLEYDQNFTTQIGAYNYGDWDVADGVKFIYVMPRGIEPQLSEDGSIDTSGIAAKILSGGDSLNPQYKNIDAGQITVKVLQRPGSQTTYYSPNCIQDPLLVQSYMNTTTDDYTGKSYYAADDQYASWVLEIDVATPLKKWVNRGSESGYQMLVDIPSHVYRNNDSEYWYDEVYASPINPTANENLYYQIYDMSASNAGNIESLVPYGSKSLSTQYAGMDYLYDGYYCSIYASNDPKTYYVNGAPNLPYIDGYNIANKEVTIESGKAVVQQVSDIDAYRSGKRNTYASTGTRAKMRKPLIRTWITMGKDENVNSNSVDDYYVTSEGDSSSINVHVENRYYWFEQSYNNYYNTGYDGNNYPSYETSRHSYTTDGGSKGTLFYPVVNDLLPQGVVPKATDGTLFTTDNGENAKKELAWRLRDENGNLVENEKNNYKASVKYVELQSESGSVEGRYRVIFQQKDGADKAKISSMDTRVFQFDFFTIHKPDNMTKDGSTNEDLLKQYQSNQVYVGSQLENFKFITDKDIANNPYYVGAPYLPLRENKIVVNDNRKDAVYTVYNRTYTQNYTQKTWKISGGILPDNVVALDSLGTEYGILNDTLNDPSGNKRYQESDLFSLEDYLNVRENVTLSTFDWNDTASITYKDDANAEEKSDIGVFTSARIRIKNPNITNESFVSTIKPEVNGNSVKNLGESANKDETVYYPSEDEHVQYGDTLYYTVQVTNGAASDEYAYKGDIQHAKINVTLQLPKIASWDKDAADNIYLIIQGENGDKTMHQGLDDIEKAGYQVDNVKEQNNEDGIEILSFDIVTKGEAVSYQDYVDGKHLPGYFASGDTLYLGIKSIVDNAEDADTILSGEAYWDESYQADTYVTFHDTAGSYLNDLFPDGNLDHLDEQDLSLAKFAQKVIDQEPQDEMDYLYDYDIDGIYGEIYSSDSTATVTMLKPYSIVRADTSEQRILISNPDADVQVAEDATIRSATHMNIYLDQANNVGARVGEFIVDYRVPFRGTNEGTDEEASENDSEMLSTIYEVATGKWEVPDSAGNSEYVTALKNKLKVHVYALLCSDGETPASENVTYHSIQADWRNDSSWIELTSEGGVSIDENQKIDLSNKDYNNRIYQIRYVITASETDVKTAREYAVPQGFRLDVDADNATDGKQEMNEIDPEHLNVNPIPENVKQNAAYIELSSNNKTDIRKHVNVFVNGMAKYVDTKYGNTGDRSRAGFYVTEQIPVISVDLSGKYFKLNNVEGKGKIFQWDSDMLVDPNTSTMLKYRASFNNLSDTQIKEEGLNTDADYASNPQISLALPYLEDIDRSVNEDSTDLYKHDNFRYIDYKTEYKDSKINDAYESTKAMYKTDTVWTWYVINENGDVVDTGNRINNTDMRIYDNYIDLTNQKRTVVTWDFDGSLNPGEQLIVECMVPLSTKDYGIVSSELLNSKMFGFKGGSFRIHIPDGSSMNEKWALEYDVRDVNQNGKTQSEATLTKTLSGLSFASSKVLLRTKTSYSEYGSGLTESGNGATVPSLVPEGSDYQFTVDIVNADNADSNNPFGHPVLYDELPYIDDHNTNGEDRNSKWSGIVNLDSIKVYRQYVKSTDGVGTLVKEDMVDGKDMTIWVGPFTQNGNEIVPLDTSALPDPVETTNQTTNGREWFNNLYGNSQQAMEKKKSFMIPLATLKAAENTLSVDEYDSLVRNVKLIYVEPNSNYQLGGSEKLHLEYTMHAPLNLPLYSGCVDENMSDEEISNAVQDVVGWNTFTTAYENGQNPELSSRAGVYLDAPADRGYIGHYVWLDENYNGQFTDEGDYLKRDSDGRWIFNKATKDINYDGKPDDPGINGVKVELLSEKGYPVNRDGEPVVAEVGDDGQPTGKYVLINEDTGDYLLDMNGTKVYSTYGPEVYTTEKDAYGNNGYYVISNIKPGKYRLRFTFPEEYSQYALTTKEIGNADAGGSLTSLDVYRKGDSLPDLGNAGTGVDENDAKKVDTLVLETKEDTPIQIDAIGNDPSTYKNYDERMTAYDVGIGNAYLFSGYAWHDNKDDKADGIYEKDEEETIKNAKLTFYEVDENGDIVQQATDRDGNKVEAVTDANGYFEVTLRPYHSYIAIADLSNVAGIYKVSPVNISTDPLTNTLDNDAYTDKNKKNVSYVFAVTPKLDESGNPIYVSATDKTFDYREYLGFGFVESGIGYIGKNVFDDINYDGIHDTYVDENNIMTEPGISGVHFILEQYYYDSDTDEWKLANAQFKEEISTGGSYTFQKVPTSYTDGTQTYLAGYRIKIDMSSLPEEYTPTKYKVNAGINDSDLPITGDDDFRYINDGYLIVAQEADSSTTDTVFIVDGKKYDPTEGISILDNDVGLTKVEKAQIKGLVWDDVDHDGQYQATDETGISNIELQTVPYYYDDGWKTYTNAPAECQQTVTTDAKGEYVFKDLPSTAIVNDKKVLLSYKVKLISNIAEKDYAATLYRQGDAKTDSDLRANDQYLTADDEYIIVAKRIADAGDQNTLEKVYGSMENANVYSIQIDSGYYDVNKVSDVQGYDAGLVSFEKGSISGIVWKDSDYDGLMQESEDVFENITLKATQYYYDDTNKNWVKASTADGKSVEFTTTTNADGEYIFENLDTYVYRDKTYYLASYKVEVVNTDGMNPDRDQYAITKYLVNSNDYRNSHLLADESMEDKYFIVAQQVTNKNHPYIRTVDKMSYDLIHHEDVTELDAGFAPYETSLIKGNVFDDKNYNGLNDENEGFSEALKKAIQSNMKGKITVTLKYSYFDAVQHQWLPYLENGQQKYATQIIDPTGDGSYEFNNVPTVLTINKKAYLAGYQLSFDLVPEEYHLTKPLVNNGINDSSAQLEGTYGISKTYNGIYGGSAQEENEGYIIAAAATKSSSMNVVDGYDLVVGRTLEEYNIGYTPRTYSILEGRIFEDVNYDGQWDEETDKGYNGEDLYLQQYYFDDEDGTWKLTKSNTNIVEVNGQNISYMKQTTSQIADEEDGIYQFDQLPTYMEMNDKRYLLAYQVRIKDLPDGFAATYLHKEGVADDCNSDLDMMQDGVLVDENESSLIIAANKVSDEDFKGLYTATVDGITYDLADAIKQIDGNDAGLSAYQTGSISGTTWIDANYDGILSKDEEALNGAGIMLDRAYYDPASKSWISDHLDGAEHYAVVKTDKDGNYVFDHLPLYKEEDGQRYLYGYRVYVQSIPDGMGATKYQQNKGMNDSSLKPDTLEITKEFLDSNEQKDGYIIVAHDPKEDRPPNDAYIIDGYDIVKGESINDYNAGFKQIAPGSIHGTVFNDENKDGLLNDSGINGVEVTLQRYAMKDGESWQFMGEEYTLHCLSDQDGNYQFDDLPAASIVNGETVIYGYRLSIETLPQGYTVTSYHKNSGNKDSDLDETTGTMMNTEEIFALAKKADATVDDLYVVNGYDYLSSSNISDINAGLCTYENGMIEGILFKDKNKDGILNSNENVIPNKLVSLEYAVEGNELQFIPYNNGEQVETNQDGIYRFTNLPIVDENGQAYIYRVRYILDNNMQFTKVYSSPQYSDQNALHMNLLSRDFSSNNQLSGITCSVTLVSRKDNQNYYGQLYQSTAYNQDRMDLAVQDKPKELSTGTGLNTDIWFIATGFSGLFLLIIMKKRKEKTKGD